MKTLVIEDDFHARTLLQEMVKEFGPVHIAVNGKEAIEAFEHALQEKAPYDLICQDIIMPGMDGHDTARAIRTIEDTRKIPGYQPVKIIYTSGMDDPGHVIKAFESRCEAYLVKPIEKFKLLTYLRSFGLI